MDNQGENTNDTNDFNDATEYDGNDSNVGNDSGNDNYDYVPPKFLEDGQPNFEKMAESYSNLEKKLHSGYANAVESKDEYEFTAGDDISFDDEKLEQFKNIAYDLGLSNDQYQNLMNVYIDEVKGLSRPEGAPESVEAYPTDYDQVFEESNISEFKEEALKMGLTPEQYQFVLDKHSEAIDQVAPPAEYVKETLHETWGHEYEKNMTNALSALESLGDNIDPSLVKGNMGAIQILAAIGGEMREDRAPNNTAPMESFMDEAEVNRIMASDEYWENPGLQKKIENYYNSKYR